MFYGPYSLDVSAANGLAGGNHYGWVHGKSRIREVLGGDIRKQLRAGNVVVLAGQNNDKGDVTTLGRGGSDLSAIAMAEHSKQRLVKLH